MKRSIVGICIFLLIVQLVPNILADDQSPPKPKKLVGEVTLAINEKEQYDTNIEHIDQDVYLRFVWGDNTSTRWLGPHNETTWRVGCSHRWNKSGIYAVTVQASYYPDGRNYSESDELFVYVGYIGINVRHGIGFVDVELENFANETILDIDWNISIEPMNESFMLWSSDSMGNLLFLGIAKERMIHSRLVFGLGWIKISITVTSPAIGTTITKEVEARLLFFIVYVTSRTEIIF